MKKRWDVIIMVICIIIAGIMSVISTVAEIGNLKPDVVYEMTNRNITWD